MGLIYCQASYLAQHCIQHRINGRVVTLGRLDYYLTYEQFQQLVVEVGLAEKKENHIRFLDDDTHQRIDAIVRAKEHMNPEFRNNRFCAHPIISDKLFYTALGFGHVDSIDMSNRHGQMSIAFDLNKPDILQAIDTPYDLVLDVGVMEHVFDVKQVFIHMTDLVKVGGHIVHMAPGNNTFDHGFYQLSPTLFNDYYQHNQFTVHDISALRLRKNPNAAPDADFITKWNRHDFLPYDPAEFSRTSFGQLADDIHFTCVSVQRTASSTRGLPPTQYLFQTPRPPYPGPW